MDVATARQSKIGRVSLVHSSSKRLLADSSLLQGEFRSALGRALERCVVNTSDVGLSNNAMAHHA
jgi:hypothetical protein